MKLFKEEQKKESWSIRLIEEGEVRLVAVDSETGELIAYLLRFKNDGAVENESIAKSVLEANGYDPYEHRNKWDEDGRIIIQ